MVTEWRLVPGMYSLTRHESEASFRQVINPPITLGLKLQLISKTERFLGEFAKLRGETISFAMSVCPSARNNSAPTRRIFMKFDIWGFFEKLEKIQISLKSDMNTGYFTWRPKYIFIQSRPFLLRITNVSHKKLHRKQKHTLCSVTFFLFRKSSRLWDNVGKHCIARQAKDDDMAHAHCMLDT